MGECDLDAKPLTHRCPLETGLWCPARWVPLEVCEWNLPRQECLLLVTEAVCGENGGDRGQRNEKMTKF